MNEEYITVSEARKLLDVSTVKMARWIAEGTLPAFESVFDRRVKLVRLADVEQLAKQIRPKKLTPAAA